MTTNNMQRFDFKDPVSNDSSQYCNLNLNQNHKCTSIDPMHAIKTVSSDRKRNERGKHFNFHEKWKNYLKCFWLETLQVDYLTIS